VLTEQTLEQLWELHINQTHKEKKKIWNLIRSKFYKWQTPEILFKIFRTYLQRCDADGSKVIVEKQLTESSLCALMARNEISAIHVPSFCPPDVAESLSRKAFEEYTHWKLEGIISTDMFYAGGSIPKEAADHNWIDFQRYFKEREDFVAKQRELSLGNWAVDRLRLDLDEKWPFGACLGKYLGQTLRPAIMRIMDAKNNLDISVPKQGLIHTDDFPRLKPSYGTFSANIYLKIPEKGGELYIWGVNLRKIQGIRGYISTQLLATLMNQGYVFDIKWQEEILRLLPEAHVIKPNVGDLVIFHSGRPHSVAPVTKGIRVTNQLFIDVRGKSPLIIRS